MINTDTLTYEYNPSGCRAFMQDVELNILNKIMDENIKHLIQECTGSEPAQLDSVYCKERGRIFPIVKCTDNSVYVIDFDLYELQIVREGYTEGELSDLCNHMQQCWSMLGI